MVAEYCRTHQRNICRCPAAAYTDPHTGDSVRVINSTARPVPNRKAIR